MKVFFFGILMFCQISAFAGILSINDYNQLPFDKKVATIEAYQEFVSGLDEELLDEISKSHFNFSLVAEAFADGTFNCIYAGWPSRKVGGKCTNPSRGNSSYPNPSGCSSNQLLCQPVFFGAGICVNARTQQERNRAFKNCESRARSQGRSIASSVTSPASAEVTEMFSAVESVCTTGTQARMAMCTKLKAKIAEIKSGSQSSDRQVSEENGNEGDDEGESVPPEARTIPRPVPPIVPTTRDAVEDANRIQQVVESAGVPTECREEEKKINRPVQSPDPNVPVIVCRPDSTSLAESNGEDFSAAIRDYGIEFYPSQDAIINTRDFRLFMHELKKFPPALLREMAAAGGKIRVFTGNGVADDPARVQEIERMAQRAQTYWDYWNRTLRNRGYPEPQTAAAVRRSYQITTEGTRDWSTVPGSGGVFSDPTLILPTRIVINKMYPGADGQAAHGATNLVLHEHGHALDSLYGHHSISGSQKWKDVLNDPQSRQFLPKFFSSYENAEEEGFAELFSYYHSCEASRRQLETHAPKIAEFFRTFTSVKDLRPDLYNAWRSRYNR